MGLKVYTGSAFAAAIPHIAGAGGFERPNTVKVWNGTAWESVWVSLANPVAAPAAVSGSWTFEGEEEYTGTTGLVVASADGNDVGRTYAWRRISGSSLISPTNAGASGTAFTATAVSDTAINATFVCDITQGGTTLTTNSVLVGFS